MSDIFFQYVEDRVARCIAVSPTFFVSAGAAFIGSQLLCRFVLLADWPHIERSWVALSPVPWVVLIASWVHYRFRVYGITLTSNSLQLHSDWCGTVIPTADLIAVVGLSGLDLSGGADESDGETQHVGSGEIIQWKKLLLITREKSRQVALSRSRINKLYQAIIFLCPQSLGVPYPARSISQPARFMEVWPRFLQVIRGVARRRILLGTSIIGSMALATLGAMLVSSAETAGSVAMISFIFILEGAGILSSGRTLNRTLDVLRNQMF